MSELSEAVSALEQVAARIATHMDPKLDAEDLAYLRAQVRVCRLWAATPTKPDADVMPKSEQAITRLEAAQSVRTQREGRREIADMDLDPATKRELLAEFDGHVAAMAAVRDSTSNAMTWGDKKSLLTNTVRAITVVFKGVEAEILRTEITPPHPGDPGLG